MISILLILTYKIEMPSFRPQVHFAICLITKTKLDYVKLKLTKTKTRKYYKIDRNKN